MMGGKVSHEFHFPAAIGDDTLRLCEGCGHTWNRDANKTDTCDQCGSDKISETKGIEVSAEKTNVLSTVCNAKLTCC